MGCPGVNVCKGVGEGLPLRVWSCLCVCGGGGAVCEGLPGRVRGSWGARRFPPAVSGLRPCPRGYACFPPVTRLLLQHV